MEDLIDRMRRAMGLTLYEARLYIAMLQGASNPREASTASGVPLPRIYDVIKALESKGLVEPEPGGWYRPRTPRAVAAAMLARLEEEARRRSMEILSVADMLEGIAEKRGGGQQVILVKGVYNIVSAVAEAAVDSPGLYILAGPQLYTRPGILVSMARGAAGVCPQVRILLGSGASMEVEEQLASQGVEVARTSMDPISLAATPRELIIMLSEAGRGDMMGLLLRDQGQAEHAYRVLEGAWPGASRRPR